MRPFPLSLLAICASVLIGCGETAEPVRFDTPTANRTSLAPVSIPLRTVSVREVTLPAYATEEGIAISDGAGAITTTPDNLWADDATRAVTLRLTNALADITGRQVASDPWPFRDDPDAVVDVRFESFVAVAAGQFEASGRYYVAQSSEDRRDHAHGFRIVQPYRPGGGFPAIAEARAKVIATLAEDIARRGLR